MTVNSPAKQSGLSFTAVDVETANPQRASICAIGLAKVRDGQVVDTWSSLVKPHEEFAEFHSRNIDVHQIRPEDVAEAPAWDTIHQELSAFIQEDLIVAHSNFDRSAIERACTIYDLEPPAHVWHDSEILARNLLTLSSYKLPVVSSFLGLSEFIHHRAMDDAVQCARIVTELANRADVDSLDELFQWSHHEAKRAGSGARPLGDFTGLSTSNPLAGEKVVFTGTLQILNRSEAQSLVESLGGKAQASVGKATTIVVSGDFDPRTLRPGTNLTGKLQRAQELVASGQPLEILDEQDFLERIQVAREALEAATREQRVPNASQWLPSYVLGQAKLANTQDLDYNAWLRAGLRHPSGRAKPTDPCIRCGTPIPDGLFWLMLERHTCSDRCAAALKRAAKRAWIKEGIHGPDAPTRDGKTFRY
ncbi:exonuclease domain-containing protein [Nesterenkonia sp. CF4.4]|uniref:exonuclease domain-containing protein n=1 Tax=Nesterenkonia sp. CF4.4 TaxID=3373079 RepID=UPI003EE48E33